MNKKQMFEQYYRDTFDVWVRRKSRQVPNVEDAEDIVQEAFANALQYLHTFNPDLASLPTWFTNIVNNTHRKMKRDVLASVELRESDIYTKDADDSEHDEEVLELLKEAIGREKNSDHRNMLYLYLIAGLKGPQIASQLGIPVKTVEGTVYRFRKKFKKGVV